MKLAAPITPCLWFDGNGKEAAEFYVSVFPDSKLGKIAYYPDTGKEIHGMDAGKVLTVEFSINGQTFTALNAGPEFKFSEAISFQLMCETQDEIDYFWNKLREGGGEEGPCGWLKDRFGLSWQVFPAMMTRILSEGTPEQAKSVMDAFMKMKKFIVADIEAAYRKAA
ncbi:MAG: VOC family protein [Xanthobacteraceae bacterium]|nr:VOC family protein [Xanthobacteraceae bacterium]QYK44620.1 MAG: VOC family protein [Xanthobacteraceae bacterium]